MDAELPFMEYCWQRLQQLSANSSKYERNKILTEFKNVGKYKAESNLNKVCKLSPTDLYFHRVYDNNGTYYSIHHTLNNLWFADFQASKQC